MDVRASARKKAGRLNFDDNDFNRGCMCCITAKMSPMNEAKQRFINKGSILLEKELDVVNIIKQVRRFKQMFKTRIKQDGQSEILSSKYDVIDIDVDADMYDDSMHSKDFFDGEPDAKQLEADE